MSTTEILVGLVTLGLIAPAVVPAVRDAVMTWLLERQVLAVSGKGVVAVPGLNVDVSGRALALLILVLVIAGFLARMGLALRRAQGADGQSERGGAR